MRISMNELTTYRWSFEEDVAAYCEAGISAIGVWRHKLSDFGDEKGIELISDSGLEVSNLLWAGGFTGSDGRTYRESLFDGADAIRLAGAMNCRCLVIYSGGRAGHTHSHARRLFTGALQALVPIAEEESVDLAIEPMHPACAGNWTFLTSLDDTMQIIDDINHPHVKIAFDTYHLVDDEDFLSRIEHIVPQIGIVHLGDGRAIPDDEQNRCRLGDGRVPLHDVVARLNYFGYDGWYDVELMGEDVELDDYGELIEHARQATEQMLTVPV